MASLGYNFTYISKIVPWSTQDNESNVKKIAYGSSCKQEGVPGFVLKEIK